MNYINARCWNERAKDLINYLPRAKFTPDEWNTAIEEMYSKEPVLRIKPATASFNPRTGEKISSEETVSDVTQQVIAEAKDSDKLRRAVDARMMHMPRLRTPMEEMELQNRRLRAKTGTIPSGEEVVRAIAAHMQGAAKENAGDYFDSLMHWYMHACDAWFGTKHIKGNIGEAPSAMFLQGNGSNGKTHLLEQMAEGFKELGVQPKEFKDTSLDTRFQDPETWSADFFYCTDWSSYNMRINGEVLKEAITGGTIRTEKKGCNEIGFFSMENRMFAIAGNNDPANLTTDKGLMRRVSICRTTDMSFKEQCSKFDRILMSNGEEPRRLMSFLCRFYCSSLSSLSSLLVGREEEEIYNIYKKGIPLQKTEKIEKNREDRISAVVARNKDRLSDGIRRKFRSWVETPSFKGGGQSPGDLGYIDRTSFARFSGSPSSSHFDMESSTLFKVLADAGLVYKGKHSKMFYSNPVTGPQDCLDFLFPEVSCSPMSQEEIYSYIRSRLNVGAIDELHIQQKQALEAHTAHQEEIASTIQEVSENASMPVLTRVVTVQALERLKDKPIPQCTQPLCQIREILKGNQNNEQTV